MTENTTNNITNTTPTFFTLFPLALRMLKRDWRSGYLTVLAIALLIAVTSHSTIGFLNERIENAMAAQSANFLGGDLVIRSPTPMTDITATHLKQADVVEFSSVVIANDNMLLSSIKAVSSSYPLVSHITISDQPFGKETVVHHGPDKGKAWLELRLLNTLNIKVGDTIEVGDHSLEVEHILVFEPDRSGGFYSLTPRVMMHLDDLDSTGVVQPGSQVNYLYQFAGPAQNVHHLRESITPELTPGQRILSIDSQQRSIRSALQRASTYLQLTGMMAILLASVALAMSAHFFSQLRYDTAALLRCLGLSARHLLILFSCQLLVLGLISGIAGGALGWGLHFVVIGLLSDLLPATVPLPSLIPLITGIMLALIILLGFGLPSLMQLQKTPPLRVLRKHLEPPALSVWLSYGMALLVLMGLMWFYTANGILLFASILGGVAIWSLTLLATRLLLFLLHKLSRYGSGALQVGLRNLGRRTVNTHLQLLGFGLTSMAMLVVLLVRMELIANWEDSLPDNTPNHFVMNIQPQEADDFRHYLQQHQINAQPLYPIVRGRLTHINRSPVREAVSKDSSDHNAINRELNLSWSQTLPSNNRVLKGHWWADFPSSFTSSAPTTPATPASPPVILKQVSVEQQLAKRLNIHIGDELTFFVAGQTFSARVVNLRSVNWETFQPNFYMLFAPDDLTGMPHTFMTSFHLPKQEKHHLSTLVQQHPSVSIFDIDVILQQVRAILAQVSAAVEYLLLFVLAAGITITAATLITTMPERIREGTLMRALGATTTQLRQQQWSEFATIGVLSGLIACGGTELAKWVIYAKLLQLPYTPSLWIWIMVPPFLGGLIGLAGHYSSRRILRNSPLIALRE